MLIPPTAFWNLMARNYSRQKVADEDAYRHKLEVTASHLSPGDRVLEFGCGTGTTALIHAPRVARIDAIDLSSKMIAIAREKAETQGTTNVRFETAAFEDWPLPAGDDRYDAVLGLSILHLVADLDATLARVRQALKPGGRFFSSTVCLGDMSGGLLLALLGPLGAIGVLPKVTPLTADALVARVKAAGFTVEEIWRPKPDAAVFIIARAPATAKAETVPETESKAR